MKITMCLFLALMVPASQAAIYKWVDGAANVHYEDQPSSSNSKQMKKLPGLSTYSPPPIPEKVEPPQNPDVELEADDPSAPSGTQEHKPFAYRELTVISPEDGGSVRSSPGTVPVFVTVAPVLRKGDYLKVILDGSVLGKKYYHTVLQLETVDRGEHRLGIAVYDKNGKKLLESKTVKFQLHRNIAKRRQPRG